MNKNIVANGDQVPFTSNGYVWRYVVIDTPIYTEENVNYVEQNIANIPHCLIKDNLRYAITIDGRVYDMYKNNWLTLTVVKEKDRTPFLACSLAIGPNRYKIVRVSILVCKHFSKNWSKVGFKDGNILNCHVDNLEEVNPIKGNTRIAAYKLSWKEDIIASYSSLSEAAAEIGVTRSTLSDCVFANLSIPVPYEGETVVKFPNKRGGFVYRGLRE